jgi:hypothetical protein
MRRSAPPSRGLPMAGDSAVDSAAHRRERRIERLIDRLPPNLQSVVRWLRRPSSRLVRIPAGALLICGGFLSILPVFGLWMFPLGFILLAEDIPPIQRARDRLLDWIEQRLLRSRGDESR